MTVNFHHAQYNAHLTQWTRCRDALCGQDAVHLRGEVYLPRLKNQPNEDYAAYKKRTPFYNATWRTVAGLKGMLLQKAPITTVPESVTPMLDDVTSSGTPFQLFLDEVCEEALGLGRLGVLVDYPVAPVRADGSPITQADARAARLQPTMQLYRAESIINWKQRTIGGTYALSMVVLKEQVEIPKGEFEVTYEDRFRVLDLDDMDQYRVRVFKVENDLDVLLAGPTYPKLGGNTMSFIPFAFLSSDSVTPETDDPPLIDLVNMNFSHYLTTADLEHGAHFCGLPTPVISGYTEQIGEDGKPAKLYIGSGTAWVFNSPNAKAEYLEFKGQGLEALAKLLASKEQQMAVLGARMLEPRMKGVEAADTAAIHRKGEESMLGAAAHAISLGITNALKWYVAWAGADDADAECQLNDDFYPVAMTPLMLQALVASWQSGAITDQELFDNLQAGQIISEETSLEEHQAQKNTAPPKLVVPPPGPPVPKSNGAGASA